MNAWEGVAQDAAARNERPMCRGIERLSGLRWTFGNINEQIEYAGGNNPNVSSSNFPYYGRSLTCCGGCLEDFCQKPFCEMFFCHNCRTNCAVLLTHKRLHVPCMHQLQRDEQR